METLSKLIGRFYIILLYLFFMTLCGAVFMAIGAFVFRTQSKGFMYLGGAVGYVLARPLRNHLATRYGLKSTKQIDKESQARDILNEGCRLEVHGKKEEAIAKYQEVINKFPELPLVADARKAIELLQSQANQDGKNTLNLW